LFPGHAAVNNFYWARAPAADLGVSNMAVSKARNSGVNRFTPETVSIAGCAPRSGSGRCQRWEAPGNIGAIRRGVGKLVGLLKSLGFFEDLLFSRQAVLRN
jgi:hypothetical protein